MKKGLLWFAAGMAATLLGKKYVWPLVEPRITPVINKAKEKIAEIKASKAEKDPLFEDVK